MTRTNSAILPFQKKKKCLKKKKKCLKKKKKCLKKKKNV
jgi:hypothetical protein